MGGQSPEDADRVLDVRDIDAEPFDEITTALSELEHGETLVLVNSFEPEPLYGVLEGRGFTYESSQVAPGEWHVRIEQP